MSDQIKQVSYCVGMSIGESLLQQNLGNLNTVALAEAIQDVFENNTLRYLPEQANSIIQSFMNSMNEQKFAEFKVEGEEFLSQNKGKAGVFVTPSGLQYEIIEEGNGMKPSATDTVKVHYHGTLINGEVFDSSIERGQPATFGVHQVIPGWTEALQLMTEGSTYRLYIPQELAYGAHPHPGGAIKPYMALVFDVQLLEVL